MKKFIILLLFFLCGCSVDAEAMQLMIPYQKESSQASETVLATDDEMQLVSQLNQNLLRDEQTLTYTTEKNIDLDEVVRMLSYLIPFDIRLTKTSTMEQGTTTYKISVEYLDSNYQEVLTTLKKIIDENISKDMTTKAKIAFAHQFILNQCEYDTEVIKRNEENASAFQIQGVLFDRKAVCSGYSRCFLLMMRLMDIPCLYVSSDVINHGFNLLYDQTYQFVDVTWDEAANKYYNLDIESFFQDGKHELSEQFDSEYYMNFLAYMYHLS